MDQAFKLRQIVENLRRQKSSQTHNSARVIAVTSGKGGVGKSNFTANLAITLAKSGYKVLILDADFGLANIDVILGIEPQWNFSHVLKGLKGIKDIITEGPEGIRVISGGSGVYELVSMTPQQVDKIIAELRDIQETVDFVLIDTGAGVSEQVLKMIEASDETILIVTPEPTSVLDAYALLKASIHARQDKSAPKLWLVVNRSENEKEATELLDSFTEIAGVFLNTEVNKLGFIPADSVVPNAVKSQAPFTLVYPKSNASRHIKDITIRLLNQPAPTSNSGLARFFKVFAGIS
ncbi:MAG TPA: MinD/ParA family protein [Clostridia bacterium]|nr:MinD/ParA family protein [Clostridia bacterium]